MTIEYNTRISWLADVRTLLISDLLARVPSLSDVDLYAATLAHISVGYPATGTRHALSKAQVGYYPASRSTDHQAQLFISPAITDTLDAAAALLAGLVKAACEKHPSDAPTRHALGLTDDYTPQPITLDILDGVLADFPDYPNSGLLIPQHVAQKGRMIKFACQSCQWQAYTSRKQLEQLSNESACPACHHIGHLTVPEGKNSKAAN